MRNTKGFTLVETLVVVLIIGILASVAYPAYIDSVRKGRRADAMVGLNDIAMRLQRCYTTNTTYKSAVGVCAIKDKLAAGVGSDAGYYLVKASTIASTSFLLSATPSTGSTQMADKKCRNFTLDQSGARAAFNSNGADATAECWK